MRDYWYNYMTLQLFKIVPALVTPGKYRPDPILQQVGLNFNGAARLFILPGLSQAYLTYPTSLVQCEFEISKYVCDKRSIPVCKITGKIV